MNSTRTKYAILTGLLIGTSAGGIAFSPSETQAAFENHHHNSCTVVRGNPDRESPINGLFAINEDVWLQCEIPDTSELPKGDIDNIDAFIHDGSASSNNFTRVAVCAIDRDFSSGECADSQGASGSGFKTLTLSTTNELDVLNRPFSSDDFVFLSVTMKSTSSVNGQQLRGYSVRD